MYLKTEREQTFKNCRLFLEKNILILHNFLFNYVALISLFFKYSSFSTKIVLLILIPKIFLIQILIHL